MNLSNLDTYRYEHISLTLKKNNKEGRLERKGTQTMQFNDASTMEVTSFVQHCSRLDPPYIIIFAEQVSLI